MITRHKSLESTRYDFSLFCRKILTKKLSYFENMISSVVDFFRSFVLKNWSCQPMKIMYMLQLIEQRQSKKKVFCRILCRFLRLLCGIFYFGWTWEWRYSWSPQCLCNGQNSSQVSGKTNWIAKVTWHFIQKYLF